MELNANEFKQLRKSTSRGSWKQDIVKHVLANQKCDAIALYDATRADKKDKIPEETKLKDLASQFTYLRKAGYHVIYESSKVEIATTPVHKNGQVVNYNVVEGFEQRIKDLLGV